MATAVFFHAHPDDEAIATGGTMTKAAADGHRVVLVVATRGERGEVPDGFLDPHESLTARRVQETHASARILGVSRVEFLGYEDSGMIGTADNENPSCFWRADVDEAAERLARILREEDADVLTVYDDHGGYGHPDHIQVHRVGIRAAQLAATPRVFEATMNRDHIAELMSRAATQFQEVPEPPEVDMGEIGLPADMITTQVDIHDHLDVKRQSMAAHASQIAEHSFFLAMPPEMFEAGFGTEWYRYRGDRGDAPEKSIFDGLS